MTDPTTMPIRVALRWVSVTDYHTANPMGSAGARTGYWCDQRSGGWWTSSRSAAHCATTCPDPVTYRTRREAAGRAPIRRRSVA